MSASFLTQAKRALVLLLLLCLSCASDKKDMSRVSLSDPDVIRYRLPLRNNPVSEGEAFRCYGACQEQTTPDGYLECLQECPGFDVTPGVMCATYEIPPVAACFTARKIEAKDEMGPGLVVLSVVAGVAITVALASVCASSASSQCGYQGQY